MKLLSYQSLRVPPCVTFVNAEQLLPLKQVRHLLGLKVPIVHISDFVRLRAVLAYGRGGWVIACDTL